LVGASVRIAAGEPLDRVTLIAEPGTDPGVAGWSCAPALGRLIGMTNELPPIPSMDQPTDQQPLPPAGAPVRPPLRRSGTDTMIGGVCGGLAEYTGIDPVLWRVGFVGLTLAGGAGVLVYLLLWVLMPSAPLRPEQQPSPLDRLVDRLHHAISGARVTPPRH
jgi:phage shock protein C